MGSYYKDATARKRSPTVRNIGYTDEMAEKFPWVRRATLELEAKNKGTGTPPVAGNASSG